MILARLAETVYWMARYTERAENTARIVMVNANLLMDLPAGIAPGWQPILNITGSVDLFDKLYGAVTERNVVRFLLADKRNPGSMINSLNHARENLRTTRSIVPRGAWESVNDLYEFIEENQTKGVSRRHRYEYLTHIIRSCQTIAGTIGGSMSHDQTYEFVRLGHYLERADMLSRVLEVRAGNLLSEVGEDLKPFDDIQWKSVLESLAAYQMYRRHVHLRVKGSAVLAFLLQDEEFPRSVSYCLNELRESLTALPANEPALRTLGGIQRLINETRTHELSRNTLNDYMDELQVKLGQVHDHLASGYFESEKEQLEPRARKQLMVMHEDARAAS